MFPNDSSSYYGNASDSDNGNEIVSDSLYSYFAFYIYNFIIPITAVTGLVGNVLASVVMVKTATQFRQSIYIYMSALTITDSAFLVVMILRSLVHIGKNFDEPTSAMIESYTLAAIVFLDLSLSSISVLIIIVMSIERHYAIVKPLSVRDTLIARFPVKVILGLVTVVFAIVIPLPFCMEVMTQTDENNAIQYFTGIKSSMAEFFDRYVMIETILLSYIPFFLVIPLNIAIAVAFHRVAKRRRKDLPGVQSVPAQQLRVVITVFVIMIMYTLFTLPQMAVQTLSAIEPRFSMAGTESNTFWLFQDVGNAFITANAATDFAVYILTSDTYRKRFMHTFCSALSKVREAPGSGALNVYIIAPN